MRTELHVGDFISSCHPGQGRQPASRGPATSSNRAYRWIHGSRRIAAHPRMTTWVRLLAVPLLLSSPRRSLARGDIRGPATSSNRAYRWIHRSRRIAARPRITVIGAILSGLQLASSELHVGGFTSSRHPGQGRQPASRGPWRGQAQTIERLAQADGWFPAQGRDDSLWCCTLVARVPARRASRRRCAGCRGRPGSAPPPAWHAHAPGARRGRRPAPRWRR